MLMDKKVYLAGPDVFFDQPLQIAEGKKELCKQYGFLGVFPLDVEIDPDDQLSPFEKACAISFSNESLMDECDLVIANLTPFRGVSMDSGTAYEIGYMRAQKKPVLGYTNIIHDYEKRVEQFYSCSSDNPMDGDLRGTMVESFGLAENLMIEIGVVESGGSVVRAQVEQGQERTDLEGFEKCLQQAVRLFQNG